MKKNKKEVWFIPEEFPDAYIILMAALPDAFVNVFPKAGAGNFFSKTFFWIENFYIKFGFIRNEFIQTAEFVSNKMIKNPDWAFKINDKIIRNCQSSQKISFNIDEVKLAEASNSELFKIYQSIWRYYKVQHSLGVITSWISDAYDEKFSNKVKAILKEKIKAQKCDIDLSVAFSSLTTPTKTTFVNLEESAIINLAENVKKNPKVKDIILKTKNLSLIDEKIKSANLNIWKKIDNLHHRYCWIVYVYMGPANNKEYYYSVLKGLLKQGVNLNEIKKDIFQEKLDVKNKQKEIIKKLSLNGREKKIFKLAGEIVWIKPYRKEMMSLNVYAYEKIFKELGKRYGLSVNQIRMCFPDEICDKFLSSRKSANILNQRIKKCFWFYGRKKQQFATGRRVDFLISKLSFEKIKILRSDEVFGTCAYQGKAKGKVKIIITPSDMAKMRKSDILVSRSTNPNIISAMKQAAAIITDTGGLTCHAAIVSRELKIPCIVGTKIATKVFKDGDKVKVDASKGIIKKI